MMRVAAHAHGDELDERRTVTIARALDGPVEGRRNRVRIGAVDRDARNPVADRLVGKDAHRRLFADRGGQGRLIVLDGKTAGSFRTAQTLMASCHSPSDDPPSPMKHSATRPDCFARERKGEAGNRDRPVPSGATAGRMPYSHIADMQIFAVHRRSGFSHLRRQHPANHLRLGTHGDRDAEIANERCDDIAAPLVPVAVLVTAAETNRRAVDRFLSQRTEPFALEDRLAVADFAVRKQRLQAIVGRPGDIMPRRISRRSSAVSDARIAARRRNPSHARTMSSTACSKRRVADTPGVGSTRSMGARR